jgi:hypothetical protein
MGTEAGAGTAPEGVSPRAVAFNATLDVRDGYPVPSNMIFTESDVDG